MSQNNDEPLPTVTRPRIPVVGVAGGVGSGKSSVANWVAQHAIVTVIDADRIGHQVLLLPSVKTALCKRFGNQIIGDDGQIVRSLLAHQVFGPSAEQQAARHDLEQIVHPEIRREIHDQIEEAAERKDSAVLLDAAVLLETGWRELCDILVFIDTPDELRASRVKETRGWEKEELHRRESSQWSLQKKRESADLIVVNDRDLESAGRQMLHALHDRGLILVPRPSAQS